MPILSVRDSQFFVDMLKFLVFWSQEKTVELRFKKTLWTKSKFQGQICNEDHGSELSHIQVVIRQLIPKVWQMAKIEKRGVQNETTVSFAHFDHQHCVYV